MQNALDLKTEKGRARSASVVFGDTVIRDFETAGAAMGAPVRDFPCGSRIVVGGRVVARLQHCVSEGGVTYAGWLLCDEKERGTR